MAKKGSKKSDKLVGFSPPPKIIEEKPEEQTGSYVYENKYAPNNESEESKKNSLFVPDDVKLERIKKGLREARITNNRIILDHWLRHELQLGTGQIKKLWKKMDEIYRE